MNNTDTERMYACALSFAHVLLEGDYPPDEAVRRGWEMADLFTAEYFARFPTSHPENAPEITPGYNGTLTTTHIDFEGDQDPLVECIDCGAPYRLFSERHRCKV